MPGLRLFIALKFSPPVSAKLNQVLSEVKQHLDFSALRWVPSEKMHLTLRFFGDASEEDLHSIKTALHATASMAKPSHTGLGHLGAFPSIRKPNVIWIGMQPDQNFKDLVRILNTQLDANGFLPETKPFSPHITLARVSQHANPRERDLIARMLAQIDLTDLGEDTLTEIHLFKSTFQQGNYVYSILVSEKLVG